MSFIDPNVVLRCCCGKPDCANLKHNLDLERNLHQAARVGQALLARHEECMAKAEEERRKMATDLEKLETDKRQLQEANRRQDKENGHLLNELRTLGDTAVVSDRDIANLTATLESAHLELRKLSSLAVRATDLEAQLAANQHQLTTYENDKQLAIQRWKNAERTIGRLQDQIDKIDREAKDERERHVEIVARLEKRRTIEEDMESTALKPRGAATVGRVKRSSGIVPNFVKDIMQDNANLQVGMVELREMLKNSNLEIESLRQQILLHPSAATDSAADSIRSDLMSEITKNASAETVPEVHVHHHYHAPAKTISTARENSSDRRRPKKRHDFPVSGSTPESSVQTLRMLNTRSTLSSAAIAVSQPSPIHHPQPQAQSASRWSMNSLHSNTKPFSPSTVASSPAPSAIFDCIANPLDASCPDTPSSIDIRYPPRGKMVKQDNACASVACTSGSTDNGSSVPIYVTGDSGVDRRFNDQTATQWRSIKSSLLEHSTINNFLNGGHVASPDSDLTLDPEYFGSAVRQYPKIIRRCASYESLLSTSANHSNPLHKRPSHIITAQGFKPTRPSGLSFPTTSLISGKSVVSATSTGRPSLAVIVKDDSNIRRPFFSSGSNAETFRSVEGNTTRNATFGKRFSCWVWGPRNDNSRTSVGTSRAKTDPSTIHGSATGIKKHGSIKEFQPQAVEPIRVEPIGVDGSLLEESLGEG